MRARYMNNQLKLVSAKNQMWHLIKRFLSYYNDHYPMVITVIQKLDYSILMTIKFVIEVSLNYS